LPSKRTLDLAKLATFYPSPSIWRARWQTSVNLARTYEREGWRRLNRLDRGGYDAVFQIGAYCNFSRRIAKPFYAYTDGDFLTAARQDVRMNILSDRAMAPRARHEGETFQAMTRVFTFSDWVADCIARNYDLSRERTQTVGAGSNIDEALLSGEREYAAQHAVFIGLDFERKGGRDVLEAFARVRRDLPKARLTIVGGAPVNLDAPGVTCTGPIARNEPGGEQRVAEILRSASLFVLPSTYEPFGIAFLEAMAAGLPCIGASVCAMPEIIGDTGIIVRPNDPSGVARALFELMNDEATCASFGRRARERYRTSYGWDRAARLIVASIASTSA
jgi:glycosyltransferase involved in cell wall biosynthesis